MYYRIEKTNKHSPKGWYVPKSVNFKDIIPVYMNAGGGVLEEYLEDDILKAIEKASLYLNQRKSDIDEHIYQLSKLRDLLREGEL